MGPRYRARKIAIAQVRSAQVHLGTQNDCPCQTSEDKEALPKFPLQEMELIEYCQQ
jgi:hypothetical protein